MNKKILILLILFFGSSQAFALRIESTDEARERHGAQRYQQYKDNGYMPPLGGYREKLGDPAPKGTANPGYRSYDY
ncbi:MAG: hypothetical protein ACJ0N6_04985 [Thermodesulfobacteriota bacterium]